MAMKKFDGKFSSRFDTIHQRNRQTDRQTDTARQQKDSAMHNVAR